MFPICNPIPLCLHVYSFLNNIEGPVFCKKENILLTFKLWSDLLMEYIKKESC